VSRFVNLWAAPGSSGGVSLWDATVCVTTADLVAQLACGVAGQFLPHHYINTLRASCDSKTTHGQTLCSGFLWYRKTGMKRKIFLGFVNTLKK